MGETDRNDPAQSLAPRARCGASSAASPFRTHGRTGGASALLTIDVRNMTTRFSLFSYGGTQPAYSWETTTPSALTPDEASLALESHLAAKAAAQARDDAPACNRAASGEKSAALPFAPDDAIVSSVVPALTDAWVEAARRLCGRRPLVVGPGIKTGAKISVNDPGELGSDRIANAVAAKERYGSPLIVVDLGATTNIEAIDAKATFCGGIIAPGMAVSAHALSEAAARLACVPLQTPKHVIGKNTREAMQSGIIMGELARIDGLIDMVRAELGQAAGVVITGANAAAIAALSRHECLHDADLTAKGLMLIWSLNRK